MTDNEYGKYVTPEAEKTSGVNFILQDNKGKETERKAGPGRGNKRAGKTLRFVVCAVIIIMMMTASGAAGAYFALNASGGVSSDKTVMYTSVIRQVSGTSEEDTQLSVQQAAELVSPTVVEITTEVVTTGSMMSQYITEGAGSGVIISSDGYIVTNNHVIEEASKITVTAKDGESYEASLIGTDSKTDIAVIKIDAKNLSAAIFADSSAVSVGDSAIVIGNPLGQLGGSVTSGIISALDREITINDEIMTLMQTDAAVNPGNSGGGMFNVYGELIGIVNAKSSGTDVEGLGFAIPSNLVKSVAADIIEYGYVKGRVDTGLTFIDINDPFTAMSYRVSAYGVYILKVEEDSPAQKAGLQAGMTVTAVNGTAVESVSDINSVISGLSIGESITVSVKTQQGARNCTFELAEYTGK